MQDQLIVDCFEFPNAKEHVDGVENKGSAMLPVFLLVFSSSFVVVVVVFVELAAATAAGTAAPAHGAARLRYTK